MEDRIAGLYVVSVFGRAEARSRRARATCRTHSIEQNRARLNERAAILPDTSRAASAVVFDALLRAAVFGWPPGNVPRRRPGAPEGLASGLHAFDWPEFAS